MAVKETEQSAVDEVLRRLETELGEFARLLDEQRALQQVLVNPVIPASRKRAAVAAITERGQLFPVLARLLLLLAERDRLALIPDLVAAYRERLLDHFHVVRAEVTTAAALPEGQAKALEQGLARLTGRTVTLATRVDPSIIGGVVTQIGSTVYDGSVTRQLQKIRERFVERA